MAATLALAPVAALAEPVYFHEATDEVSDELRKLDKSERAARLFTLAASPGPAAGCSPNEPAALLGGLVNKIEGVNASLRMPHWTSSTNK